MSINTCQDCMFYDECEKAMFPGDLICGEFEPLPTYKPVDLLCEMSVTSAIRKHGKAQKEFLATYEPMIDFKFLRGRKHNRIRQSSDR